MAWLGGFGWWKVAVILAMFVLLFLFRSLSGGKPDLGPARRRRRRFPPHDPGNPRGPEGGA